MDRPTAGRALPGGRGEAEPISPGEFEQFRHRILGLTRIDLNQYKSKQLLRRLGSLCQRYGVRTLGEYAELLAGNPDELRRFRDWFTINVSEFFRDPVRWTNLRDRILPELLRQRRQLRIWCAGCSHGAEPYSLGMVLADLRGFGPHQVLATDIDPAALAQARAGGPFGRNDIRNVSPAQLERFFTNAPNEDQRWLVKPEIQRVVTFRQHDMLRDSTGADFDLITCRNVIIYFTDETKAMVFERFHRALRPGGILFIGATELITRPGDLGFAIEGPSFYRRL